MKKLPTGLLTITSMININCMDLSQIKPAAVYASLAGVILFLTPKLLSTPKRKIAIIEENHLDNKKITTDQIKETVKNENLALPSQDEIYEELSSSIKIDDLTMLISLLEKYKVDINARYTNNNTLLMAACFHGKDKIVKFLIKKGADINAENDFGTTPLLFAERNGHNSIIDLLFTNLDVQKS